MGKVSYVISSKDRTKKGINSAKKNINSLGKSAKSASNMMKLAFAGFSLKALSGAISSVNAAFKEQSEVNTRLNQVLKSTGSAIPYKEMKKMADSMSRMTGIPDEVINQSQTVMSTFKAIGEKTFPRAIKAAMDMSKTLKTDLQGSTIQVSKALNDFSGFTALKEAGVSFTEEQENMIKKFKETNDLASYQDLILKELEGEFGGVAEAMGQTDIGAIETAANTLGDIKEKIGGVFTSLKAESSRSLQPIFDKVNGWLADNSAFIINIFKNLPTIALSAFNMIKTMVNRVFTVEFWQTFGSIAWDFFKASAKITLSFLWDAIKAIGTTIWEPLKFGFESIGHGIRSIFSTVINWIIDKINDVSQKAHNVGQALAHPFDKSKRTEFTESIDQMAGPGATPVNNVSKNITDAWGKLLGNFKNDLIDSYGLITDTFSEVMEAGGNLFGEEMNTFLNSMDNLLEEPLSVDLGYVPDGNSNTSGESPSDMSGFWENVNSGFSDEIIGKFNTGIGNMTTDMGSAGTALGGFAMSAFKAIMSIESVAAIMNPFKIILDGIVKILKPIINDLLAPIIGFLSLFGQMLGKMIIPILKLLTPVLELVSMAFIFIYNYALRPFGNAVIWLVSSINNFVANMINAVISALNHIPFVNIRWRMQTLNYGDMKLDAIDAAELNQAGAEYAGYDLYGSNSSTNGSSAGASYAAKGDIYINVEYSVGISAFDDRDIALKIRDEIDRAEAMGF